MSACNILTRVLLPKKDPNIAEVRFVPGGNPVPAQYHIPLMKKVPMFPAPTGCLELYTSKIGHQAYINKKRHGFDLTDPYNYNIDWSYNITQDPHMLHVIRTPAMMKRLKELGQITNDERVRCTLKQFNNFRAYLKCKSLIDFRNQLQEEKARIPKIDVGESLEVVAIEHRVHEQEVRFRRLKSEDETFAKYQSHLTQSETKFNIRKRKRQEVNGVLARKRASIEKHRQDVYRRSLRIAHQRHRNLLQTWKQHAQRQISHLQEVDSSRLEEKLQVKWNARRETQLAYEELVEVSRAAENDRRERSKVVLDLEMNRRWQLQAHKLQMLKDVSRKIQAQREEAYARNLIKAFANSSILNPQKKPKPTPTEDKSTKTPDAVDMSSIPKFKTIFCKPVKKSLWVLEKELKKMGVTTRILATVASKEKEVSVRKMEVDSALAIASRTTIDSLPRKKKGRSKSKRAYPTSVELMGGENAHMKAGEEIWVLKKREDIVNDTVDEVTDAPESEESDSDIVKEENIASRDVSAMGGFIGLLPEDLELMEGLLTRLLDNVQEGRLNQADLVQMIMFCSTLQSAQLTHIEQTTSTTSLMAQEIVAHSMALLRDDIIMRRMSPTDLLATAANIRACQSEISSVSSDRLEILLKDTMEKMADDIDIDEDDYNEYFLEQMLRSTVANLTVDIERGTLSRTNVHEIGSALAQAVMDDMDSDDSLMAEDTLMTILQQLQQDIDTGQIDEKLLDKALASLVSSYGQVLRGRSNIDVIKELVLYVLLRTRHDLEGDLLDKEDFLKQLQLAKIEAGIYGMELPELPELVEETSKAIGKFKGIGRPDEAVVALIKMILGPGRRIMPAIAKSRVHWISESMIEQAEGSEVQLQIVLDLAASVCASFTQQMNEDMDFARDAERVLGPRFLVMLFSYWDQLDLEKGRETVAVQTRADELANLAGVKATLAENVVLVCFNWLWQDALNNRLPVCIMPHVALDTAEFPSTRPLLDRIRNFGNYMDKMNLVDEMVLKKVRKVGQELQEGGLGHEEAQALLTICVHSYLREVVFCDRSDDIVENGSEPPGMVSNVQFLITTCARSVLEYIQNKVARRLSALGHTALELSMVTDILMEAASDSIGALNTFVTNNSEAAEDELLQLDPLIKTSQWNALRKDPICKPQEIPPFLKKLIGTAKRARELAPKQTPDNKSVINQPSFKVVKDLIRRELWQIAKEVASLFNGLVSLHNLLPPKPSVTTEALLHFAKSLLLELRHAVIEQTLPLEFAYDFVKQIAEKKCPIEAKESADRLVHVIMKMVKDIELRNDRSNYYVRIVMGLSKMSLPKKEDEDVAAGMAAIAHLLSTVDKSVLTTFLQSTLMSMLRNIRALRQGDDEFESLFPISSRVRRAQQSLTDEEMPTEGSWDEETIPPECDIIPETKIVVHVALQKTMERMGAAVMPPEFPVQSSQTIVQDLVSNIQESPDKGLTLTGAPLETSLVAYAQGLATEISRNLQDEATAGSPLSNKSIANVIIGNTLKSINSGIKSGKIHLSVAQPEEEESPTPGSLSQRLSFCVSATLKAVKSELNLVNLMEKPVGDDKGLSEEESKEAIEKARRIVDYLIKRVGSDIEEARVEFHLTQDNELSVVQLSPSSAEVSKRRSDSSNNFWKGPSSVIADCVVNTFQDVLLELQKHNQFFDPKVAQDPESHRDSSVRPGLPYLVEKFILSHLLDISGSLHSASSKAPRKMKKEDLLVARALYDVLQDMLREEECSPETSAKADLESQEMMRRRKFILGVLKKFLPNAVPSKYLTSSLSAIEVAEKLEGDKTVGTLEEVMKVMHEIVTSVKQSQEEEQPMSTPQPYPAPGDAPSLADVVVQTTQQTALYVREGQVQDHDLRRLSAAFDLDVSEEEPTEVVQTKALECLEQLVVDVRQGKIPRNKLQQAAQHLNKEAVTRSHSQATSLSISTQELLKQAVTGLMEELTDRSQLQDNEEGDKETVVKSRKESLDERTVSKTDVRHPSDNRMELSSSRIYSTTQPPTPAPHIPPLNEEAEVTGDDDEGKRKATASVSETSESRRKKAGKKLYSFSRWTYSGTPVDVPMFLYRTDSDSSSRDLLDSEIVLAQSDSATAHRREDIAETGEKQIRSSCSPTPLQKTAVDESRRLDGPLEAEEQTDEDGQKVASISGLSDTASSTKDSEHHQTSELTAPDSQCPRVESATKTSEKTGEEKSKGHLKEGSVSPLLETASSPLDSEHYIPSKSTEKIGEQTGEGGLQAAPVQVLLDTVSSPLDSDHYMHSKMIGTASEPTLRDTKMSLPDTGFISDGHLPKEMDDSGEIVMRKESILDMLDTVGSPMDSGQPCQPTDTTSFLEASESGSNDSVKVKETEDIPETASEAGSHDVSSRQTTTEPQDTGFQTDSQYAEAPVETVSEDDTRNSVSPNLPDDEKQDCNRSAVTSSRTNHLARVETWSRSPSLVPQKVKTTGSLELQKSPAKKYKKLKRRSSRRDNLNKRCEELLLPINKWKTLLDGILPANEESTPTLWSSGSRRSRRTNNPNTKHRKRSASQNAASSLSTKTTLDTSDKQPRPPFHLDDTTEASSGPSPPKGMVGAQKKRTSLRTHNPSSGKLPKVTESNSAPREDRFPHGDESGAHVSRSRLTKALDASTNRSLPLDPCPSSSHQFKTDNITIPQVKKNPSHMSKSRNDARSDSTSSNILTTVTSLPCPPGQQPKDPHLQSLTSSCPSSAHKLQKTAHKQPVREMTAVSQSNSEKKGTGLPYCSKRMSTADIEAWLLEEQNKQEWKGRRVQKETHPTREKLRRPASSSDGPRLQTCAPAARIDDGTSRCKVSSQQQQQRQQHQQEQHLQQKTTPLAKELAPRNTDQYGRPLNLTFARQLGIGASTFKPHPPPPRKFYSPPVEILEDGVHHKPTSKVRLLGVVRGKRRQTGLCPMVRTKVAESPYSGSSFLK